jgi:hypothetical protein
MSVHILHVLPAFSIGMFHALGTSLLSPQHSFPPLYFSILLFFFSGFNNMKKTQKKNMIKKRERGGKNKDIYLVGSFLELCLP